jgi:hypothetical protein
VAHCLVQEQRWTREQGREANLMIEEIACFDGLLSLQQEDLEGTGKAESQRSTIVHLVTFKLLFMPRSGLTKSHRFNFSLVTLNHGRLFQSFSIRKKVAQRQVFERSFFMGISEFLIEPSSQFTQNPDFTDRIDRLMTF